MFENLFYLIHYVDSYVALFLASFAIILTVDCNWEGKICEQRAPERSVLHFNAIKLYYCLLTHVLGLIETIRDVVNLSLQYPFDLEIRF